MLWFGTVTNVGMNGKKEGCGMLPPVFYRHILDERGKEAYRILTDSLLHLKTEVRLPYSYAELNDVRTLVNAVSLDHPELFYINWWHYRSRASMFGSHVTVCFDFLIDTASVSVCCSAIEKEVAKLKHITSDNGSLGSRYKTIIKHIVSTVHYNDTGSAFWDHTAAGPILNSEHTAVCEGIAKLFLLYCQHLYIPCAIVIGTLNGSPHAWNLIEYNGTVRYIDITSFVGSTGIICLSLYTKTEEQLLRDGYQWNASQIRRLVS